MDLDSLPKTPINTFKGKTDKDRDVWVFFLSNDLVAIKDNNCSAFDSHCKGWKNYYKI